MKLLLFVLSLLIAPSLYGQSRDDRHIFGLTLTRYDMPRLCTLCDADLLDRDTVRIPYAFANNGGSLWVVFDSSNTHRESFWHRKDKDNYEQAREFITLVLTILHGSQPIESTEYGLTIYAWPRGSMSTRLYCIDSLGDISIHCFYGSEQQTGPRVLPPQPKLPQEREG